MKQEKRFVIIDNCAADKLAEIGADPIADLENTEFQLVYTPDLKREYEDALASALTSVQARKLIEGILEVGSLHGFFGFSELGEENESPFLGFDQGIWFNLDPESAILLIRDLAKGCLESAVKKHHLTKIKGHWYNHLGPVFDGLRVVDVDMAVVKRYVSQRQAEGADDTTIDSELNLLRRMFKQAVETKKISLAACPHVPRVDGCIAEDSHQSLLRKRRKRADHHLVALAQDAIVITNNSKQGHWRRAPKGQGQVIQWEDFKDILVQERNFASAIRRVLQASPVP
jgi:hypothetical protein